MFYEKEYTRLIRSTIREETRHQGGIYRKATADFGRSCVENIKDLAGKTIQIIREYTPSE